MLMVGEGVIYRPTKMGSVSSREGLLFSPDAAPAINRVK